MDHVSVVWAFSLPLHFHMPAYKCCLELRPENSWTSADVESDLRGQQTRSSMTIEVPSRKKWRHWKKQKSWPI